VISRLKALDEIEQTLAHAGQAASGREAVEKISQLGLRLSRSTRPVSASEKEDRSLTWTPWS
jgi:hypothetical protein